LAAGLAGAAAARKALGNPYLIPGDREVLQLRIDHPDLPLKRLAQLARMTPSRFNTKYYGALSRTKHSPSALRKELPDKTLAPHQAARLLGFPPPVLTRWTDAGLVECRRTDAGYRRYVGREILRVKDLLAGGVPDAFATHLRTRAADTVRS
jgi:hypothetical protein